MENFGMHLIRRDPGRLVYRTLNPKPKNKQGKVIIINHDRYHCQATTQIINPSKLAWRKTLHIYVLTP